MYRLIFALLLCALLLGCDSSTAPAPKKSTWITLKKSSGETHLYYEGRIVPAEATPLISEIEGTVNALKFQYGDSVQQGQVLLQLSSPQRANEFHEALSHYLQQKNTYESARKSYRAARALQKAGVISQEEYQAEKNNVDSTHLAYFQAKQGLEKVLQWTSLNSAEIERLALKDTSEIQRWLHTDFNKLDILAPISGTVFMPPMNEATNSISNSTLSVGSSIKVGQVLALIADAQRLGVLLKVHEADINAIHVGEHVMVTGLAFPEQKMLGTIVAVASQAQSPTESAADASLFAVRVEIPRITAEEAQKIRVGMSAQVDIVIHPGVQLMLPLNAVHTEHDQSWVEKKNPKTQRIEKARVRTGMTTATEVSIVQGLQEGDQVRVYE